MTLPWEDRLQTHGRRRSDGGVEFAHPSGVTEPDVVADISQAEVRQVGKDRVHLSGVRGHPRPATLKSNVFFEGGWLGDGEISYAGPNAEARARLGAPNL